MVLLHMMTMDDAASMLLMPMMLMMIIRVNHITLC